MGEKAVERSLELFGLGMIRAFCLETIVTDQLRVQVSKFRHPDRAGTNLFISGSPYSGTPGTGDVHRPPESQAGNPDRTEAGPLADILS